MAKIVRQFFENKVGHVRAHLLGEMYMQAKSLIGIEKSTYFDYEVTESGHRKGSVNERTYGKGRGRP